MKRTKSWLFIVAIIVVVFIFLGAIGYFFLGNEEKSGIWIPADNDSIYSCEKDSDCVPVDNNCCSCNSGGKATFINQKYVSYWENQKKNECSRVMCIQVISDDPSCYGIPICTNNRCDFS